MGGAGGDGDSCRPTTSPTTTTTVHELDGEEYVYTLPSQVSTKELFADNDVDKQVDFAGDKNIWIRDDKFAEAEFENVDSNLQICEEHQRNDESKKPLKRARFLYQKEFFPSLEEMDSDDDMSIENFEEDVQTSNSSSELEEEFLSDKNNNKNNSILLEEPECDSDFSTEKAKSEEEEETQKVEEDELDQDMAELIEELRGYENNKDQYWEHQNLVEQLKMELRNAKKIRLPTILEESESPKTEVNPSQTSQCTFDERILQEGLVSELQKLHKSYKEQMRKFDILNYQKMYTIGFLNLKEQLPKTNTKRNTVPSFLPHTFRLCRPKKSGQHPLNHLAMELYGDLETVYVGQTCLSWELLQWQYGKVRAMADSDAQRPSRHTAFVAELEQFQVLIQRFLENETFQGPRVHNYVKARCVLRSLLQVPSIADLNFDAKQTVLKMIENSMRVFWEFVLADKEETAGVDQDNFVSNSLHQSSKLIHEIRIELNKKEKKLNNLNRASHCLAKKIQKLSREEEERANQEIFMAQIDLRLVSRVLMMYKTTTNQFIWCQKKLNRIRFSDRKVHREQSFLLFPF